MKPLVLLVGDATVYDVTRRETFTNLSEIWAKEIDLYSTNQDCVKMLVGNKVDKVNSHGDLQIHVFPFNFRFQTKSW